MGSELTLWQHFRIMCRLVLIDFVHNADSIQTFAVVQLTNLCFLSCFVTEYAQNAPLDSAHISFSRISFRKTKISFVT